MNRDQRKGAAERVAGKAQQKVGELSGNWKQQAKGAAKQFAGSLQQGVGDAEKSLDKAARKTRWVASMRWIPLFRPSRQPRLAVPTDGPSHPSAGAVENPAAPDLLQDRAIAEEIKRRQLSLAVRYVAAVRAR